MRVLVPIKQVAVLSDEFHLSDGRIDPDDLDHALNEWDEFSLEAAQLLVEGRGGEVVVVTVGDEDADDALLACLGKGADRAIRVWDDGLEDPDVLTVARVLAAVAERESPDLVLCGVQSSDAVNGATGVALAGLLGFPRVAVVRELEVDADSIRAVRELEGAAVEDVEVPLPALLTIQTGINAPRYATMRAIRQARDKPLDVLELGDLGLQSASLLACRGGRVRRLIEHESQETATMLTGDAEAVAVRITEIVKQQLGR